MALIVEDGSGLATAQSYLSVADADTYHTAHSASTTWSGAAEADKEKALRLATQYLDALYGTRWVGSRWSLAQALDWPRSYVVLYDIYTISTSTIPQDLKDACAELALKQIADTDLIPDLTNPGSVASESVSAGSVSTSTTYVGGGKSQLKRYRLADNLLRQILKTGVERS
tara:strand:+ start:2551 stop:3063 length:513 start_codon:yes stop_codon:yes gene_type:complete